MDGERKETRRRETHELMYEVIQFDQMIGRKRQSHHPSLSPPSPLSAVNRGSLFPLLLLPLLT